MQGRRDIALSAAGRAEACRWRIPDALAHDARWIASPLSRACETARLLRGSAPQIEPALTEMDWGAWEGSRLAELRARDGAGFAANEARGLDFRPPRGESPRDVMARVGRWLAGLDRGTPIVAVTHNGVLRALVAIATGWDMRDKPPVKLQPGTLHCFALGRRDGELAAVEWNVPLAPSEARPVPRSPAPSRAPP